jgi:hypothetical protein
MKRFTVSTITLTAIVVLFSVFISCKKEKDDENTTPPITNGNGNGNGNQETATISGKVSTPSGKAVGYASVFVGTNTTHTDHNGEFSFVIPAGNQTLTIQTGNGKLFKRTVPVNLSANQSFRMADSSCVLLQVGMLGYIPGDYDRIEAIIIDSLGYSATAVSVGLFTSPSSLAQFDAIFLNCLNNSYMQSPFYQNLDTFVQNGGSLYVSDWAVEYLTGNGVPGPGGDDGKRNHNHSVVNPQASCSNAFAGGFMNDTSLCTVKGGPIGMMTDITITDPGMITALGNDSINVYYDLEDWEIVIGLDAPFATTMQKPGFPGVVAAEANMSSYYSGGGKIIYTTFHNHPSSFVSQDVITLLQYFIMNL